MTRLQGVGIVGVALAGLAGAVAFFGAACEACTPQQQAEVKAAEQTIGSDAQKVEPFVFGGCSLADRIDPAAAGAIDLICMGAEAVDSAAAALAPQGVQAKIVSSLSTAPDGGGRAVTLYRVRCALPRPTLDAGADR